MGRKVVQLVILLILFIPLVSSATKEDKIDEVVIDVNPGNFNTDFTYYDQLTSTYLAQLSDVAYWGERRINILRNKYLSVYNEKVEIELVKNPKSGSQVVMWKTEDFLVLAFRGTQFFAPNDWVTDFRYRNGSDNSSFGPELVRLPKGHKGFRNGVVKLVEDEKLFDRMKFLLVKEDLETFPVYTTGHSLGAALSQIIINPLSANFNFKGSYHYAPPLAVSCDHLDEFHMEFGDVVYDIVNHKDFVSRAGRNDTAHFGQFMRICKAGEIFFEKESFVKFDFLEGLKKETKLHKLVNHTIPIKDEKNDLASIIKRSQGIKYPCIKPIKREPKCPILF